MIPAQFEYVAAESRCAGDQPADRARRRRQAAGRRSLAAADDEAAARHARVADRHRRPVRAGWRKHRRRDLVIGATTRHADLAASELARAEAPLLAYAAAQVGDPQIRHRGTIGGSLSHADPAADLPMALVALGGSVVLQGPSGTRTVAADDFFEGYFETAMQPDELLIAVRVPRRPGVPWGYQKFVRRANDWAIVGRRRRRRPDRAGQYGAEAAARHRGRAGAGRRGDRRRGGRVRRRRHLAGRGHARRP